MKIDINNLQPSGPQAREGTTRASDGAARSGSTDGRAQVSLSGSARLLNELQSTIAAEPEIDQDRVATIKARIEAGTYHVDPDRLASSFLELESLLNQ